MRLKIWFVILSFFGITVSQACTSIVLNSTDNGRVYARTMEFGIPLKSAVLITPRGYDFKGVGIDGAPGSGKNWASKYAVIGANAFGLPIYVDGLNEAGLAGGLLNAPNTALYQNPTQAQSADSIASQQLLVYVLTNFANIDEVMAFTRDDKNLISYSEDQLVRFFPSTGIILPVEKNNAVKSGIISGGQK